MQRDGRDVSQRRRSRTRRRLSLAGRLLVFAAVLHFLVLPQIGGTRQALHLLTSLNPVLVVAAVGLEAAALVAYSQLTRALLPAEHRPALGRTFRVVLSSLAVNHVVPGGAAAGGVVQYRLLTDAGADATSASFAMATQAIGSAVVLNLLLWIGLVVSIPASGFNPIYATAAFVGVVLFTVAGGAVVALTRGRRRTLQVVTAIADRTPRLDAERISHAFERSGDQLTLLVRRPREGMTAVGWAAVNWLLDASVLWLFLGAFGHWASIPGLLVAYGLANVLAAIPLSPGGLGVIETTLVVTLVGFGSPRAVASLGVSAYRLVQFWAPIPAGVVAWASLSGADWRHPVQAMKDRFSDATPDTDA